MKELIEDARQIFRDAMRAIDISAVFREKVQVVDEHLIVDSESVDLSKFKEILLVGFGKASLRMGFEMEALIGGRLREGLLVCDRRQKIEVRSKAIIAGHPVPDENSLQAGRALIDLVRSTGPDSLIIFLISGGGSAMVECPLMPELSLEDFKKLNLILVNCGASIREINTIRKRFSKIKGGGLWAESGAARGIALYISDVNIGDISSIASSPLIADSSSEADFQAIIEKYSLLEVMPASLSNLIKRGEIAALPRPGKSPSVITHHVLLDNRDVVDAALSAARKMGYVSQASRDIEEGDYRAAGDELFRRLVELQEKNPSNRVCLVSGGELSCPVTGGGFGGRNQEFVLYCASRFASFNTESSIVVLSCGTDGIDGNSCAAGAIASSATLLEAEKNGLDYSVFLKANDSHSFFKKLGGLMVTGPTGNNVRDIRIMLSETGKAGIT